MIEFKEGKIFVEGVETTDPELIGFAVLDFQEQNAVKKIELTVVTGCRKCIAL